MGRAAEERPLEKALSDPVIQEFKERVVKLRKDKQRLLVEYQKTRSQIIDLYNDLEDQPSTNFQHSVTDSNIQSFPLDPDTLEKVAVSQFAWLRAGK